MRRPRARRHCACGRDGSRAAAVRYQSAEEEEVDGEPLTSDAAGAVWRESGGASRGAAARKASAHCRTESVSDAGQ